MTTYIEFGVNVYIENIGGSDQMMNGVETVLQVAAQL